MYPKNITTKSGIFPLSAFGGINRRIKGGMGEFTDMMNLLPSEYPCLKSSTVPENVLKQDNIVKWMVPRYSDVDISAFSGVLLTENSQYRLYINGQLKTSVSSFYDIFDFNGQFISIPEFKGYNYRTSETVKPVAFTDYLTFKNYYSNDIYEYSTISYPNYSGTVYHQIKEGDSIVISGITDTNAQTNNTYFPTSSTDYSNLKQPVSITVTKVVEGPATITLYVLAYKANGSVFTFDENTTSAKGTLSKRIPVVSYACVNKNRVWALAESGETIYASELGLPLDFYHYGTASTDSWYGDVGTPGKFTGIGVYQNRVLAFKEDNVHIVYGDTATDFSIFRNYSIGCIDGKSVASAGDMLIWLYHDGFYAYTGGKPQRISDKLDTKYTECTAFADNRRYYARCKKTDGTYEMLIYDTEYDMWHKLDDFDVLGGEFYGGTLYAYNSNGVFKVFGSAYGDFYAESTEMTFDTVQNKALMYLYVRALIKNGFLNIYTSVNNSAWVPHKGIEKSGKSKLPIRYSSGDTLKIRLEGSGDVTVLDMNLLTLAENR